MLYVEAAFYRADEKAKKVRIRRCCWEPRKLSSLWENEETGRRERCSWRGLGEGEMAGSISENVANIRSNTAISNPCRHRSLLPIRIILGNLALAGRDKITHHAVSPTHSHYDRISTVVPE